ncbi:uncharacterized protein B0J16DRAFT_418354 [Fusarium flagelliforme]|uniref:Uncharacterized protein n=1 Tax=Fusarium flagelliforme TaxID=2675880 RepID=A0A395MC60_9HYPO|nr:uncharacterized protein B0J16DRAFT_418354 [Fusarium flagelliforme]KAH7174957.1 hypothetical protein B0J16DRAFT_418354 [Fusarium flagelliforme]RFN44883.1 hypothetical protein FIE12Z_10864 [Fusarium flagelliforme]
MSVLFVLIYMVKDAAFRRCVSKRRIETDEEFLDLFSQILVGLQVQNSEMPTLLENGITLEWTDVYAYVNPFGDRRGNIFNTVWTFDLDKELCDEALPAFERTESLPSPYWNLEMEISPRRRSFLGRLLTDFSHTWRHILRRPMNSTAFKKLTYATIWISTMQFNIYERQAFEMVNGRGGPYVWVLDLPSWDKPEEPLLKIGSTLVVITQHLWEGIAMASDHGRSSAEPTASTNIYAILTLRQITLCKMMNGTLVWTRPETLFIEGLPAPGAIDMLIWATTPTYKPEISRLHLLPLEIQDKILHYATSSSVSAGRLGCILSLGSTFPWTVDGKEVRLQERKRNRAAESPVESQIHFNGLMSGLSYRSESLPVRIRTINLPKSVQVEMGSMGKAT